ncbi:hypothetical protein GW7_06897 [Heterocephalus glaber]|uniref:Uncharacterized protein n=1 Tax=Heterocephalus glaber TaxID=10181 RepID=G5B0P4_HETGA|nr:hypothetical protein GW7_06897 [Heterocephalus glaber]
MLRPLWPAGGLLPPHHLLPIVVHGRGVQTLLLGVHQLPACDGAGSLLPAPVLPACALPHDLQGLQLRPLLLLSSLGP